jgi:signal transduction histidine kinase
MDNEGSLSRSEPSFVNALRENLASAIVFVSAHDEALAMSPEAGQLLGFGGGGAGYKAVQLPAPLLALARQGLAGCSVSARQIQLQLAGRELSVDLSVVPLLAGPEQEGALLVLNDAAAERRFEAHLHQVNRLANTGTLAAGMAHEIKNALVAGKTFVDLLLEKNHDAELAQLVRCEIGRIDAIVSSMLKLAGSAEDTAGFTRVRLHEVLNYTARLLQRELNTRGILLELSLEAESDFLNGNEHGLQQAVLNLLLNGLEALEPGGKLVVTTRLLPAEGNGDPAGPWIHVCIADNGPGIPAKNLPHVFEPFFTTKPTGTGLGLAITRRIIDAHGGRITVESQPGQGCCFELRLPAMAADPVPSCQAPQIEGRLL